MKLAQNGGPFGCQNDVVQQSIAKDALHRSIGQGYAGRVSLGQSRQSALCSSIRFLTGEDQHLMSHIHLDDATTALAQSAEKAARSGRNVQDSSTISDLREDAL